MDWNVEWNDVTNPLAMTLKCSDMYVRVKNCSDKIVPTLFK